MELEEASSRNTSAEVGLSDGFLCKHLRITVLAVIRTLASASGKTKSNCSSEISSHKCSFELMASMAVQRALG